MKKLTMLTIVLVLALGFISCPEGPNKPDNPDEVTYTISFDNTGGTGGQTATVSATVGKPMPAISAAPSKTGYNFNGYWDAEEDGEMYYKPDRSSAQDWDKEEDATLYAQWSQIEYTTISFNANGGVGTMTAQQIPENTTAALAANAFTRTNFTFQGWAETAAGAVVYDDEEDYTAETGTYSFVLYAVWMGNPEGPLNPANLSTVSLVQSTTVTQASNFTTAEILAMVREAITLAGGLEGIVKTGDTVVLKPNVVTSYYGWGTQSALPMLVNGVATDWRVIQSVATVVREIIGPTGRILLIEGPGIGGTTSAHFSNVGWTTGNLTAVDEIIGLDTEGSFVSHWNGIGAQASYATLITLPNFNYTNAGTGTYSGASGRYNQYYNNDGRYYVNTKMLQADALISLPVLKTHNAANSVTGAIKNIGIGAAPVKIDGLSNTNMGRNGMVNHNDIAAINDWVSDYFSVMAVDFTVMDSLQGLGNGPAGYANLTALQAQQQNIRSILASRDALAIDIVEANIMNWDYSVVRYFNNLAAKGQVHARGQIGQANPRMIPLRGNPRDIVVVGNRLVDDVRRDVSANSTDNTSRRLTASDLTKPTVSITSAAFSGNNLILNLALSTAANNNVVKVDLYIGGTYRASYDTASTNAFSFDAASLAAGSYNIEVRAYTKFMASAVATTTVIK